MDKLIKEDKLRKGHVIEVNKEFLRDSKKSIDRLLNMSGKEQRELDD